MRSIYETVLYKRTPEELEKICKDPSLSKTWSYTSNGILQEQVLYDSVTRENKYTWKKGRSMPYKKWYAKHCPKVSHDYTLGQLIDDAIHSPMFHISLALIWIGLSSYINYKLANNVSEDDENKLAGGLIVSSYLLHNLLYVFLFAMARPFSFSYIHTYNIVLFIFLLINPITIPAIILGLNLANVKGREKYKQYLWKINTGFSAFYGVLGVLMGWVSLWFWM